MIRRLIKAFDKLGAFLRRFKGDNDEKASAMEVCLKPFETLLENLHHNNPWFTSENVRFALERWGEILREEDLMSWANSYAFSVKEPKRVAVIMAGNVPLAGFHDFLCVLSSGHRILVKNASGDDQLLPFLSRALIAAEPALEDRIAFVDGSLRDFDAAIATGSDNTARYFEYYFRDHPTLIRKNRVSIAILRGDESPKALYGLGQDVLRYFGRGCRNVSKIFIPRRYDLGQAFRAFDAQKAVMENLKYAHNYHYHRIIYSLGGVPFKDSGVLLLKEDVAYHSPISVLFYEYYDDLQFVMDRIEKDQDLLQCVVGDGVCEREIPFGRTQRPALTDYADGVDTMRFLERL